MKVAFTLLLVFAIHTCTSGVRSESSDIVGHWKIKVTFKDGSERALILNAQSSGKVFLTIGEPRSNMVEPTEPTAGHWERSGEKGITVSGPVDFPVGNFGREQGTMVFKCTFESADVLTGDLAFYPMDQNPKDPKAAPSKTGTFRATRVSADDAQ